MLFCRVYISVRYVYLLQSTYVKKSRNWYSYEINPPFEISFGLPELDNKRTSVYSPQFIKELKKTIGGNGSSSQILASKRSGTRLKSESSVKRRL